MTTLWVFGRADTAPSELRSNVAGWTTAWLSPRNAPVHAAWFGATFTVTLLMTERTPHHLGFRTSTAVPPDDTDCTTNGPADRSMAGLNVSNP